MKRLQILIGTLFVLLLVGCSGGLRVGWMGSTVNGRMEARYAQFSDDEAHRFQVDAGETIAATYEADVAAGELTMTLLDPDGATVWQQTFAANDSGDFEMTAESDGRYQFVVAGNDTEGSYSLRWEMSE